MRHTKGEVIMKKLVIAIGTVTLIAVSCHKTDSVNDVPASPTTIDNGAVSNQTPPPVTPEPIIDTPAIDTPAVEPAVPTVADLQLQASQLVILNTSLNANLLIGAINLITDLDVLNAVIAELTALNAEGATTPSAILLNLLGLEVNPTPPPSVDCTATPNDSLCIIPTVDCNTDPTQAICQIIPNAPVDCTIAPNDPSCPVTPPTPPVITPPVVDCSVTPNDVSCPVIPPTIDCNVTPSATGCPVITPPITPPVIPPVSNKETESKKRVRNGNSNKNDD